MLINCAIREDREKVGRRYQRVRRYFVDVQRLAECGFLTNYGPGAEVNLGDIIQVTRVPSTIHNGSLGSWRVVAFSGPYARCEKVEGARVDMGSGMR